MEHITRTDGTWVECLGYSKKLLFDGKQIGMPGVIIQMVRIRPGYTAQEHHHRSCTEYFYFPACNGEWYVDGQKIDLQSGDSLVIQPGDVHEVRNTGTRDFVYIAFKMNVVPDDFFAGKPE
ncbi:cupin domain-containing protein [Patescibacteria group bacterium]